MSGQANGYHGLMNQGSTCYLNSVLQVLFMTEDFREAVTRNSEENPHSEFLDHHLKALFDDLQYHTAYTYKITQKLGINNVYEQRDAAEYFERVLRMTSPDASKIFHGQLANKTTCSKGHIQTDGDAPFWHLPLSLVDSCSKDYSVVKGIEEFFKPSDFCGENQMYCEQCDHKVDATMTDVIKHHPDVLCLMLKRFEFNYKYMSYVKITCSVEVPYTLHIPESQTYELYAFVDHFGDLRGGHYSSTIKIQEEHGDRWYQFDDTRVTELDFQPFQLDNTDTSQTAYLLFYRKKKAAVLHATGIQDFKDLSTSEPPTINNELDQSQDGKNKRKRRRDGKETDTENNPKVPCLREAEGSPDTRGTENDDLDQKHTAVDDVKNNGPNNNPDLKSPVSDTSALCDDLNRQNDMTKLMDNKSGKDEKAEDRESEEKSHAEHPADTVGENMCEHQENKGKTNDYYIPCPNHGEEEEEEKTKTDFQQDTKRHISVDKPTVVMYCDTFQDKEKVIDRKENRLQDDLNYKHGKGTLNIQQISVTHSTDNDLCVEAEITKERQTEKQEGKETVEKSSQSRSERWVKNNEGNTINEEHEDRRIKSDDTGVTQLNYQLFQMDNTEKADSQLLENVKSHKNADQANLEVSDNPPVHGHLNKQDVMNDGQKELMDFRPETDKQTDNKWVSLTADHKNNTDYQCSEGSGDSRKDTGESGGGRQNVGNDYSSKSISVEADKVTTGQRNLLTRYDLFHGSQDTQTGSDRIQIIPKDNQMNEQRSISRFLNEPIEEEDVMDEASDPDVTHSAHKDVCVETQRRSVRDDGEDTKEADKYIQMSEITTENPDNSEAVKHEVIMRLDGRGQKTAEKIISVTCTSQSVGGVQIQSKEQKNVRDTKQNQSEGNKITTERQTEKQEVGSDENIEFEHFQPKGRTGAQRLTEGSKKSNPFVKVIDEEHTEIDSACKDGSQRKIIIKKIVDETTEDMTKWIESQRNIRSSLNL